MTPNNAKVICPECAHQFRAIPVDVQRLMLDAGFEPPFTAAPQVQQAAPNLTAELQQRCTDWGAYWRAPDAHGVELTPDQALILLREALGVEVEIKPRASGCKQIECLGRPLCSSCVAMAAPPPAATRQPLTEERAHAIAAHYDITSAMVRDIYNRAHGIGAEQEQP